MRCFTQIYKSSNSSSVNYYTSEITVVGLHTRWGLWMASVASSSMKHLFGKYECTENPRGLTHRI